MEITLYNTLDNDNVINKDLTMIYSFSLKLKKDTDIVNPTILLNDKNSMDFTECNYCYLEDFNRYYFIRDIESINNNIWRLVLECDVLETYKDDILNSDVEINRKIKQGDFIEGDFKTQVIKEVDIYKSDVIMEDVSKIILSTIGG